MNDLNTLSFSREDLAIGAAGAAGIAATVVLGPATIVSILGVGIGIAASLAARAAGVYAACKVVPKVYNGVNKTLALKDKALELIEDFKNKFSPEDQEAITVFYRETYEASVDYFKQDEGDPDAVKALIAKGVEKLLPLAQRIAEEIKSGEAKRKAQKFLEDGKGYVDKTIAVAATAKTIVTTLINAVTNSPKQEQALKDVANKTIELFENTGNAVFNAVVLNCSNETLDRVESTFLTFEKIRKQPLSSTARQAAEAIAHYAVCKSMTEEQRGEVFDALMAGGKTLSAVKKRYFSSGDEEGETSFIQWVMQAATIKLAQIDKLVSDPEFKAKEAAQAKIVKELTAVNQWAQDVSGITEFRNNISNSFAKLTALFKGTPPTEVAIVTGGGSKDDSTIVSLPSTPVSRSDGAEQKEDTNEALVIQNTPQGGGDHTAESATVATVATVAADGAPPAPAGSIFETFDNLCDKVKTNFGTGFCNIGQGLLCSGVVTTAKVVQRGFNQLIPQPLQAEVKKTWQGVRTMAARLLTPAVDEDSDIESDDESEDETPPENCVARVFRSITGTVNSLFDLEESSDSQENNELSMDEMLQDFSEIKRSEFCNEEEEDYTKKSKLELNKTIELITLKSLYQTFTSNGASVGSFEAIVNHIESNPKVEELKGEFKDTAPLFLAELKSRMNENGRTPWYTALFINAIVDPILSTTLISTTQRISKSFYDQVKATIDLKASDNLDGNSLSTLEHTTDICEKIMDAIREVELPGGLKRGQLKKDTIYEKINGTIEDHEDLYREATNAFLDLHFKDPIKFLDNISECAENLLSIIKNDARKERSTAEYLLLPFQAFAYAMVQLFKFLMTIFIKPLNMIINAIAKNIAINNGFFEEVITSTIESLSGENNGHKTIVLDELFKLILDEANQEIKELLSPDTTEPNPLPPLTKEESKIAKDFISALLGAATKHNNPKEDSLEERIGGIDGIGKELVKLSMDQITLLLYNIYKKVTTRDQMNKYVAKGLEALNENLRHDTQQNITQARKRENALETEERQNAFESSVNVLGRNLVRLCVKIIKDPIHPSISDFQKVYKKLIENTKSLEFSPDLLKSGNDTKALQSNLEIVEKTIKHLVNISEEIKAIYNSPKFKLDSLRDQLTPITSAIHKMSLLFTEMQKYYLACLIDNQHNDLATQIKGLDLDLEEYFNTQKEKLSELCKNIDDDSLVNKVKKLFFLSENLSDGNDETTLKNNSTTLSYTITQLEEFINDIDGSEDDLDSITNILDEMLVIFLETQENYDNDLSTDRHYEKKLVGIASILNKDTTGNNHKKYNGIKRKTQQLTALTVERRYYLHSISFFEDLKGCLEVLTTTDNEDTIRKLITDKLDIYKSVDKLENFLDSDEDLELDKLLKGTSTHEKLSRLNSRSVDFEGEKRSINTDSKKLSIKTELLSKLVKLPSGITEKNTNKQYFTNRLTSIIEEVEKQLQTAILMEQNIENSIKDLFKELLKDSVDYQKFINMKNGSGLDKFEELLKKGSDEYKEFIDITDGNELDKFRVVYKQYTKAIDKAQKTKTQKPSYEKTKILRIPGGNILKKGEGVIAGMFTDQLINIKSLVTSNLFTTRAAHNVVKGFFLGEKNKASA